jgi:hypothetical protein
MFFLSPIKWAIRLPALIVLGAAGYVVVSGVQVITASRQQVDAATAGRVAAIVVLPAPLNGRALSPDLIGRLQEALQLSRAGVARQVIVAGTPAAPGDLSPALVAKRWLVARHVSPVTTLATDTPTATFSAVAALVGPSAPVVAVTDAMDALFTRGAAAAAGLRAEVAPAVGSTGISVSDLGPLWRQATGVAVGRVVGYQHAGWAGG